ncbi:MAG: DUF1080 domain-containing protein [Saprospiraceae bacterium]|nr:DUF1080 domain-containing protein [Saprospiraceae bacterium]
MSQVRFVLFVFLASLSAQIHAQDDIPWEYPFNGSDLSGWNVKNGTAEYQVEDGVIVGTAIMGTPNTFLCTDDPYGDFILELEAKIDYGLNSGIQIRSESKPEYMNGRVHGYQVELDPSDRRWTAGIYDEARRGWLYPLTRNHAAAHAFKVGDWNHIRIEAIGPHIRTWVNGVQCADLVDDMTSEGFIGLQVHSIRNEEQAGLQAMWKNLKIISEDVEKYRKNRDPDIAEINYTNHLSEIEKRQGWRMLWDGKTHQGWRGAKLDHFPTAGWVMNDGVLTVLESGGAESRNGGDIITVDTYSDFELIVDFKITPGANSGIKYFVDPELNKGEGSAIGLEFQILDDGEHPDAKMGVGGNRTVGSLYDLIPAFNLSEDGSGKRFSKENWNRARIVVKGSYVEHWLNEVKVVEFKRGSQIYRALVEKSKYKDWPNFGEVPAGHILLQDHGNTVHFKNIKIREF